jgi:hypothetical protein
MAARCTNSATALAAVLWMKGERLSSLEVTSLSSNADAVFP